MGRLLLLVVLAGVATGCFDSSTHASGDQSSPAARPSTSMTASVVVRVTSNQVPAAFSPFRIEIHCGGDVQVGEWASACIPITRNPARFTDSYINPICIGGLTPATLRVDGTLDGKPIHLGQSGMCGPQSIYAWYRLLRGHTAVPKQIRQIPQVAQAR